VKISPTADLVGYNIHTVSEPRDKTPEGGARDIQGVARMDAILAASAGSWELRTRPFCSTLPIG